ncbi:MAG: bifunctional pyr operon transcriptional regulator/uracil phosphoribosyltransferase PyrR [Gammaproteobacteria bacterium HGW-Gammaproteobacteria-1]|jgi:pyrimidine operon attenuation protein/uracil phosphoribosyltransferase|nr:MAG: bifunctional pyr operon transcriptional regulator/uracil phosphoribosyltransferase PyrR [Gammaproteobacteria bacterium HGW-Gammaproteobacteria-1]
MTTQPDIEQTLSAMAAGLRDTLAARGIGNPCMVGIHTGGVWVARRLHALLGLDEPLGTLDISFYRDDFSRIGVHPQVKPSNLPFDVEGRHIVLVDDVLYTGRTIRAALNEIFDYGRPASVMLAVLVERGGRELPIQADVAGLQMDLEADQQVKLTGPDNLALTIQSHAE